MNPDSHSNSPATAEADLKVLSDFLGSFDLSALAHARADLTGTELDDLRRYASDGVPEGSHQNLAELLRNNEIAIETLAKLLKGEA